MCINVCNIINVLKIYANSYFFFINNLVNCYVLCYIELNFILIYQPHAIIIINELKRYIILIYANIYKKNY